MRRGTIVGFTTAGGANHALPESLPGGLTAFVPQARAERVATAALAQLR